MAYSISSLLRTIILALTITSAIAEPVQYCRFGHDGHPQTAEVDFCMGLTTHHNSSSSNADIYLTMTITRSSALGWTAIGTGPVMAGSLMFIMYGDPYAHKSPMLSIRTVAGHRQPKLISQDDTGGADIRVLESSWIPVTEGDKVNFIGKVGVACYSCERWAGSPLSVSSTSQPWIWAWEDTQMFTDYSLNTHLTVHKHHGATGGFGSFFVDMARSVGGGTSPPSIKPHVATLGTSDRSGSGSMKWFKTDPTMRIHGLLLGIAFIVIFPLGVIAMRSGSAHSFKYHWMIQLIGSIFTWAGITFGIMGSSHFSHTHQWVGIVIGVCSFIQSVLGWRHHVVFVRIKRRQCASYGHIWLGRAFLLLGWGNVIMGMLLSGSGMPWLVTVGCFISVDAVVLVYWVWAAKRRAASSVEGVLWKADRDDYFVLAEEEEGEELLERDITETSNGNRGRDELD